MITWPEGVPPSDLWTGLSPPVWPEGSHLVRVPSWKENKGRRQSLVSCPVPSAGVLMEPQNLPSRRRLATQARSSLHPSLYPANSLWMVEGFQTPETQLATAGYYAFFMVATSPVLHGMENEYTGNAKGFESMKNTRLTTIPNGSFSPQGWRDRGGSSVCSRCPHPSDGDPNICPNPTKMKPPHRAPEEPPCQRDGLGWAPGQV